MRAAKLWRHWRCALKDLQKDLSEDRRTCLETGEAEAVRRFRVRLRRLRLYSRLGRAALGEAQVASFQEWAKRVSDASGTTRDHDITMQWIEGRPEKEDWLGRLGVERVKRWQMARRRLRHCQPFSDKPLAVRAGGRKAEKALLKRYGKLYGEAWDHVENFSGSLIDSAPEPVHELRRSLRRVRYLYELSFLKGKPGKDRLFQRLVAVQDALGEAQNCVAYMQVLFQRRAKASPASRKLRVVLEKQRLQWLRQAEKALAALKRCREWKRG